MTTSGYTPKRAEKAQRKTSAYAPPSLAKRSMDADSLGNHWLAEIHKGLEFRHKTSKEAKWKTFEKYYNHEFETNSPVFNLVYMHGRTLLPSVIFRSPQVVNIARRQEYIFWASILDSVDNYLIYEMEVEDMGKDAVLNAYLFNAAPIQIGFDFNEPTVPEDRARRKNFPWVDTIQPSRVIYAPGTRRLRTCRWASRVIYAPVEMVKEVDGINKRLANPTHIPAELEQLGLYTEEELQREGYICFYETRDAIKQEIFWLRPDGRMLLDPREDLLQVDGLPLEQLTFNRSPNSIWGTPDAQYIEGQMWEGNDCRKAGMLQRRASLAKFLIDEALMTEDELENFFQGDYVPGIRIKNLIDKKITDSVAIIQPHIPMDLMAYQRQVEEDSQKIVGFGPNQLGTSPSGRRTRYETQVVQEANQIRINDRREELAKVITGIMNKTNQLVVKYWKGELPLRVVGVDGALYWVKMTNMAKYVDVKDEIMTTVSVDSMLPANKKQQREEMVQIMQLLAKTQGANIFPLLRQLLSKFEWANVQEILPMGQQAGSGPMEPEQFVQQQQGMLSESNQGNLQATLQNNLQRLQHA